MRAREPLPMVSLGCLARAVLERIRASKRASPRQIPGFKLAHPKLYIIYELLEHVKRPDPKLQDIHGKRQQRDILKNYP